MSSKNLLILGMGLQGKGALHDVLAHNTFAHVTVADCGARYESEKADYEARGVRALTVDANDEQALRNLLAEHDVVIELLPISLAHRSRNRYPSGEQHVLHRAIHDGSRSL